MSGSDAPARGEDDGSQPPQARVRKRSRVSVIWIIPLLVIGLVVWLSYTTIASRGPLITITFKTANGLSEQQTQVKHKNVGLGTVEGIKLSHDMSHVVVQIRMTRQAADYITDRARFWVVRPRLSPGNISGLETLVTGAYIEIDPGAPGGNRQVKFTGLEDPPGIRSDEPGHTFVLQADELGSLGPGSPVFYRDVTVGEVLSYDLTRGQNPIAVNVFVRAPFDSYIRPQTRFWNASGVSLNTGPQGLHLELESIQAVISGGIAFGTADEAEAGPESPNDAKFHLYSDKSEADAAGFRARIAFVSYFDTAVRGLDRGSGVEIFGIKIGNVTDVKLELDTSTGRARVRVAYEIQPERIFGIGDTEQLDPILVAGKMVGLGLRAVLDSSSIVTGTKVVSLQYIPGAKALPLQLEDKIIVVPSQSGGLDNIMTSLSDITTKLDQIPFADIGHNVSHLVLTLDQTVGSPQVKQAIQSLQQVLDDTSKLVRKADAGATPVLKQLPQLSQQLQQTLARARDLLGAGGYGGNSDFQRSAERTLDQVNETVRSVRLLADFLTRHPEALIRGRTGQATGR